jgi:hypothetical protein
MLIASTSLLTDDSYLGPLTKQDQLKPDVSNGTGNTSGFYRSRMQVQRFDRLVLNKNGAYPDILSVAGNKVGAKMCSQTGNTSVQKIYLQFKVVSG